MKPAVLLMLVCTLFHAVGTLFLKMGAGFGLLEVRGLFFLSLGFSLYVAGGALMMVAFKGGDLTALYPIMGFAYVWIALLSVFILSESISLAQWAGIGCIVAGVWLLGGGGWKANPSQSS